MGFVNDGKGVLYITDVSTKVRMASRDGTEDNVVTTVESGESIETFRVSPSDLKALPIHRTAKLNDAVEGSLADLRRFARRPFPARRF